LMLVKMVSEAPPYRLNRGEVMVAWQELTEKLKAVPEFRLKRATGKIAQQRFNTLVQAYRKPRPASKALSRETPTAELQERLEAIIADQDQFEAEKNQFSSSKNDGTAGDSLEVWVSEDQEKRRFGDVEDLLLLKEVHRSRPYRARHGDLLSGWGEVSDRLRRTPGFRLGRSTGKICQQRFNNLVRLYRQGASDNSKGESRGGQHAGETQMLLKEVAADLELHQSEKKGSTGSKLKRRRSNETFEEGERMESSSHSHPRLDSVPVAELATSSAVERCINLLTLSAETSKSLMKLIEADMQQRKEHYEMELKRRQEEREEDRLQRLRERELEHEQRQKDRELDWQRTQELFRALIHSQRS